MYYCPNCKKKFRQYRKRCPVCDGPCYRKDNNRAWLIAAVVLLSLLLAGLIIFACIRSGPDTPGSSSAGGSSSVPSSSVSSSSTAASSSAADPTESSSETTVSTAPTEITVPPTTAPSPTTGLGLYTRAELEALDTSYNEGGYGPGRTSNKQRPSGPVSEQKQFGKYGANFIAPDNNNIYLTFDCGYEYYVSGPDGKYPNTGKILDVLKEKNAKAVFFVTMDYVKSEPELVQRMIDEGHAVGNHTNHHPVMPAQTIDKMEYEVMSLHDYVKEHFGYTMTLFRPPQGAFSVQSLAVLHNLGYKSVFWSFAYYDYDTENQWSEDKSLERITSSAHSGAIYLLHAISTVNAATLDDAIDYFRQEGYQLELFT